MQFDRDQVTKEQSELKRGPAQNRSEGFEGQGRIYKATHSAFFGAARPSKYHAMLIFGSSDMFPTALPPVLHSLYVCASVHIGQHVAERAWQYWWQSAEPRLC